MKKWIIGILLFSVGIYLIFSYLFTDIQVNHYKSIADVHGAKAIERGWVPAILPKSAYGIVETHDLDTNELYGRFHYKQKDETVLMQHLNPIEDFNDTYVWKDFLFRVDTGKNIVKYRNNSLAR